MDIPCHKGYNADKKFSRETDSSSADKKEKTEVKKSPAVEPTSKRRMEEN